MTAEGVGRTLRPARVIAFLVPEKWRDNTPANTMRMVVDDTPDPDAELFDCQVPSEGSARQFAAHNRWGRTCRCDACGAFRRLSVNFMLNLYGGWDGLDD